MNGRNHKVKYDCSPVTIKGCMKLFSFIVMNIQVKWLFEQEK